MRSDRKHRRTIWAASVLLILVAAPAPSIASSASTRATLENGLRIIEANYLFDDELDAGRLLGAALEAVEAAVPRAHAFAVSSRAYVLESGDCRLHLEIPTGERLDQLSVPLTAAAELIDDCLGDLPDEMPSAVALLLGGLLSDLDPYSTVFDSRGKREHTIQFRGKLAGIGARIGTRRDALTLINVYPDSPAARAGLRSKDKVTRIDGISTVNMRVTDAVERIRGDVGTQVVLTIAREDEDSSQEVVVTRGLVTIPSVEARILESGNVYAAISHFSQTTPEDFRSQIGKLLGSEKTRGVIIDLRGNSGGSMLGSSAIADAFLDEGLLITTAGRHGRHVSGLTGEVRATRNSPFRNCPVAILTSPRTASGSELMAASLRNNDRAILVGQPTFGKGTVQKTYALGAEDALKLTVGNFLPRGLAIPAGGLVPDVEIRTLLLSRQGYRLPPPKPAPSEMEFWQRNPSWLTVEPERHPVVMQFLRDVSEEKDAESEEEAEIHDSMLPDDLLADPAVAVADEILHLHGSTSAQRMITDAAAFLRERAERATAALEHALTSRGVDWARPAEAGFVATVFAGQAPSPEVVWNPQGHTLRAGEEIEIELRIVNPSSVPRYRVRALLDSETGFLRGVAVPIGRIDAGAEVSRSFKIKVPSDVRLARLAVDLVLEDDSGTIARYQSLPLFVDEAERPHLAHRVSITRGEQPDVLELQVEIANRGPAAAGELRLQLTQSEFGIAELLEGTTTFPSVAPEQSVETRLHVKLLASAAQAPPVELLIFESDHKVFIESEIALVEGYGEWREPPRIQLSRIEPRSEAGGAPYGIVASIADDKGLVEVRTAIDGDRRGFFDMSAWPVAERRVMLPWDSGAAPKRYEVVAKDADGLVARYVTDL